MRWTSLGKFPGVVPKQSTLEYTSAATISINDPEKYVRQSIRFICRKVYFYKKITMIPGA
ncbi:Uncharacterised protein [Burkholderia pseudomallei]|nr:Uncharacterised protein [Burkholderia pseudomallei]